MRHNQPTTRARAPRHSRRRLLSGALAAAVLVALAACGDDEVEHGKFKLRSGASW
jgi:hypothetical protein